MPTSGRLFESGPVIDADFYWLAGFLEGEGSFMVKRAPTSIPTRKPIIVLTVASTDGDVMARAARILGASVNGPYPRQKDYFKPLYQLEIRNARAVSWMRALRPHMGERRQLQIDMALNQESRMAAPKRQRVA